MYNHVPDGVHSFRGPELLSYHRPRPPPGASLSYTSEFAARGANLVLKDDDVFGTFSVMGFSLAGGSSPNSGLIFAPLKPIDERTKKGPGHSAHDIVARIGPKLFGVPGGILFAAEPPAIAGLVPLAASSSCCRRGPQYLRRHRSHRAYDRWRFARSEPPG